MLKKYLIGFILLMLYQVGYCVTIPSQASGNYSAYCKENWTKRGVLDTGMYDYCVKKEIEGYNNLVFLVQKNSRLPWLQKAVDYSVDKWSKKGSRQDSMVYYTVNKFIDGWEDLQYEAKQPNFNKARADSCQGKWDFQYDMVIYCYKKD